MAKILNLTLKAQPFEVMYRGEKRKEFRKPTKWILSRLIDSKTGLYKNYDAVTFTHGYQKGAPKFSACFDGFEIAKTAQSYKYSNGLTVDVEPGDVMIKLTPIL